MDYLTPASAGSVLEDPLSAAPAHPEAPAALLASPETVCGIRSSGQQCGSERPHRLKRLVQRQRCAVRYCQSCYSGLPPPIFLARRPGGGVAQKPSLIIISILY